MQAALRGCREARLIVCTFEGATCNHENCEARETPVLARIS